MFRTFFTTTGGNASFFWFSSFCNHDVGKAATVLIASFNTLHQFLDIVWDFRNQANLSTTGYGSMQCDPTGIASHYFHDHHPMMTFCGGDQLIKTISGYLYGCLKTKGDICCR